MLKHINDPRAQKLAKSKEYIALYVPMYLEFVTLITNSNYSEEKQIQLFQFAFNCLLAHSLLIELEEVLSEENDGLKKAEKNSALALSINDMWFNDNNNDVSDLASLTAKLNKLYFNFDVATDNLTSVPTVFKRQIGTSLLAVKEVIAKHLGFTEEPTWIICIDEAEFLSAPLQRCINNVFRSDSRRIALKVATLPYYHCTLETLDHNVSVSAGNDFCYRVVDMKYDDVDFYNLTNALCVHRMKTRFDPNMEISCLEDFVGMCGNDDQIDYFRKEVGEEAASYDAITQNIIAEFSEKRRLRAEKYPNPRKTVYDKFAPIYYVRSMYKLSKRGNTKPGWYAGSQMIRKISQGNPRTFIQIMNKLFEKARKSELTPKVQQGVIIEFAENFCSSTKALEIYGPTIYNELTMIAEMLKDNVHNHYLKSAGCNFLLTFDSEESFISAKKWLQQAIAYSRIIVDEASLENGLTQTTNYMLANTWAAYYWLPMRADVAPKRIKVKENQVATYTVNMRPHDVEQLSIFEVDNNDLS